MNERIYVYGHDEINFPTERSVIDYLTKKLFENNKCRYRATLTKNADIIVFSWRGSAYGHMVVEKYCKPTLDDKKDFLPSKKAYIIKSTGLYSNSVKLSELGIVNIHFGRKITPEEFEEIKSMSRNIEYHFCSDSKKTDSGHYPE
jgi:hypothetical protein